MSAFWKVNIFLPSFGLKIDPVLLWATKDTYFSSKMLYLKLSFDYLKKSLMGHLAIFSWIVSKEPVSSSRGLAYQTTSHLHWADQQFFFQIFIVIAIIVVTSVPSFTLPTAICSSVKASLARVFIQPRQSK